MMDFELKFIDLFLIMLDTETIWHPYCGSIFYMTEHNDEKTKMKYIFANLYYFI